MDDRHDQEEIYSQRIKAGKRTYFFDVKATRGQDYYLTITESKRRQNGDDSVSYEKHKIFLYKEDFLKFVDALQDAVDYVREAFRHAKPSGALGDGAGLLAAAGITSPGAAPGAKVPGVSLASQPSDLAQGFIADMAAHRHWDRAVKSALTV